MPAPLGSWISVSYFMKNCEWETIYPASCLALVEHTDVDDGEKHRAIIPMGFLDQLNDFGSRYEDIDLHASRQDAADFIRGVEKERLARKIESGESP